MSPLQHSATCIYCGGTNRIPWKHWLVCLDCHPEYEVYRPPFKPTLFEKGIPKPRRHP